VILGDEIDDVISGVWAVWKVCLLTPSPLCTDILRVLVHCSVIFCFYQSIVFHMMVYTSISSFALHVLASCSTKVLISICNWFLIYKDDLLVIYEFDLVFIEGKN
jgi:hypothetical protein